MKPTISNGLKRSLTALSQPLGMEVLSKGFTPDCARAIENLPDGWLLAALRAAAIAFPGREIRFAMVLQSEEPMANYNEKTACDPNDWPLHAKNGVLELIPSSQQTSSEPIQRFLVLPTPELSDSVCKYSFSRRKTGIIKAIAKLYGMLYGICPMLLDRYRQIKHRHKKGKTPAPLNTVGDLPKTSHTDPTVMWISMHWLEHGGAEAWALEQIKVAKEAGFKIILTADIAAPQRLFASIAGVVDEILLPAHVMGSNDWLAFASRLVERYRVGRMHIHHSSLAYATVGLIKDNNPEILVEDSTHIFEYGGGGFVGSTIRKEANIDLHHVISPQLRDILIFDAGIPTEKVVYRPLTNFTKTNSKPAQKPRDSKSPLTVGFLGRLALQKRPFLFINTAATLNKQCPGRFKFIMQGSGELSEYVASELKSFPKLTIEQRSWGPIGDFFQDIDILLVCSENEGLTLTSLEADAAGVLVLSADVGSQVTVTAKSALLPRDPFKFRKAAVDLLDKLSEAPGIFEKLLHQQHLLVSDLRTLEDATSFFQAHYRTDPVEKGVS